MGWLRRLCNTISREALDARIREELEAHHDAPLLAALADDDPPRAGRLTGPDGGLVADAGIDRQRVPGGRIRVHEARAGRGVVGFGLPMSDGLGRM